MKFGISTLFGLALAFTANAASAQDASLPGPFGPPSWDTQYPDKERFLVLSQFNNEAVLDRETGLVWQRSPLTGMAEWSQAMQSCRTQLIGNRLGWRLPSYEEMSTLMDPKHTNPDLPANNPFENFTPMDLFWTATTAETSTASAYSINFQVASAFFISLKDAGRRSWCVRGGQATQNPF